ncbi:hypothetical protein INT47_007771, partial [Mucor saturninus]
MTISGTPSGPGAYDQLASGSSNKEMSAGTPDANLNTPLNEQASAEWQAAQDERVHREIDEDIARIQIEQDNQEVDLDTDMPLADPITAVTLQSPTSIINNLLKQREATTEAMVAILSSGYVSKEDHERAYEMSLEIEKKNSIIQSLASTSKPVPSIGIKGTEASKYATNPASNEGLSLNRTDLPRLQITGKTYSQFRGERVFKSIDDFIKTFEEVVASANQNVKTTWKKLITVSLADVLKAWMRKELLVCDSWAEAKEVLEKKFGNRQMRVLATKELISMCMHSDENISDFDNRFIQMVEESEYQVSDRIMADLYFLALPAHWQTNVMTVVNLHQVENVPWTAEDVYKAATNVFGDKTPNNDGSSSGHKRKSYDTPDANRAPKKRTNHDAKFY